ncbi:MAG TPA: hypothetical protein VGQ82_06930 [Chthoniobacterales bacterium]|nr:hypothetical protein [Chthoniobacterales bacterium]
MAAAGEIALWLGVAVGNMLTDGVAATAPENGAALWLGEVTGVTLGPTDGLCPRAFSTNGTEQRQARSSDFIGIVCQ